MANKLVLPLPRANVLSLVGGKAFSLCQMINAGFNVPNGFVITTDSKMQMNEELGREILDHFDKLGSKLVAVRSSAIAEDSSEAAWAGQMDTFLNISRNNLLEKVHACWKSAKSERATAYAKQKNLQTGSVAVIVQQMVPSGISGVAFSVHPVSRNMNQIVIEAVRGLGEQLVSGAVTPDNYIVDKKQNKIVEVNLAGTTVILSDKEILVLAKEITKIEDYFGFPVDVEWAIAKDKLFILQGRPITTL